MIEKQEVISAVEKAIESTGFFIVDVTVDQTQKSIVVEIDSPDSIDIDASLGPTSMRSALTSL